MEHGNIIKKAQYKESYLFLAESILLFILLAVKLFFFYAYIGIGPFSAVMTAATLFTVMVLYFLIMRFTGINPAAFLKIIYAVICFFMFTDRVYFSYLNKMPSFSAAKMAHQLPDISEMILQLVTFSHALYVLDLPLLLIFDVNYKKRVFSGLKTKKRPEMPVQYAGRFIVLAIAACMIAAGTTLFRDDFKLSYFKNEIIAYHTCDALSLILGKANAGNIDISPYIPTAAETDSEYYGIGSGKNVITIQVEALQSFVIGLEYRGQEVTPNLNALIAGESLYFNNYYYQVGGGNTADVEFTVNNSLYAPEDEAAYVKYQDNDFYGLQRLLKDNGYSGAYAFHGYKGEFWNREKAYPKQGFDDYISEEDLEITEKFNMGISDVQFFKQSAEYLKNYRQPFYAFLITLSSHFPYSMPQEYCVLDLLPDDRGTLAGDYLQSIHYLDAALGLFLDELKETGLYENSVISVYGDHYAVPSSDAPSYRILSGLLGHGYYEEDIFKVPFIIHVPGSGIHETIGTIGGHIDNLPTLLHILGIENKKSLIFGQNLITAGSGIVYQQTHMARGSFISDDVILYYPDNGIMINAAAVSRKTGGKVPTDGYDGIIAAAVKVYSDCDALIDANRIIIG